MKAIILFTTLVCIGISISFGRTEQRCYKIKKLGTTLFCREFFVKDDLKILDDCISTEKFRIKKIVNVDKVENICTKNP